MPGVVELIDRAVDLPPGPQLSALLAELPWSEVPNARLVEVLQARSRQLAHEQAGLLAGMAEIGRAVPVAGLPERAVARAGDDVEWAAHEIAAGLTWTPTATDRELGFARVLVRGLPLVFAALEEGLLDRGKAKVFADHLDPARGELTLPQVRRLCERFVPLAPGWTAARLSRRLLAAIQAIDPEFHRRRYRRGLQERGVVLHLDRDGTATLSGEGLPPDEAAAAAARLDRLAEAAKRAGHPGRLAQISADLYLGMLDGSFHGLTEAEILDSLLARPRPDDGDGDGDGDQDAATSDAGGAGEAAGHGGDATRVGSVGAARHTGPGEEPAVEDGAVEDGAVEDGAVEDGEETSIREVVGEAGSGAEPAADPAAAGKSAAPGPAHQREDRRRGEWAGIREGIELRVGLGTLLGCDQRPAEIPGLGPVDAEIARAVVARQRRGAQWRFAIVDRSGYLLLAGPLRRRPRAGRPSWGRVRGGVVELHLTLAELSRFAVDPELTGGLAGMVAEIAERWADRHRLWRELSKDPRARFARGALARHVQVRDRTCVGPGCDRPARRSELDHTWDHARGGHTVDANIGPGCRRHHADKDRGWGLTQPEPGRFVWTSPLGRTYRTRGEPVRPDLPDPDPPPEGTDRRDDPRTDSGRPLDLRVLWRGGDSPVPRSPAPDTEEEPPF